MKKILILFLVSVSAGANSSECRYLKDTYNLSNSQIHNLRVSHELAGDTGMGNILAAISYYESSAGINLVNKNDPSAGHHHVLLTHALSYFGLEATKENLRFVEDALIHNVGLSAHIAMQELEWWLNRHKGDLFKALRSYNQGYYWRLKSRKERTRSYNYAINVIKKANEVEKCGWG